MRPTTATRKLAELRAKTDRQLVNLITGKLERGCALLRGVDGAGWDVRHESYNQAEEVYREAARLASAVGPMSEIEHHRMRNRLDNLRKALDAYSHRANRRVHAACS